MNRELHRWQYQYLGATIFPTRLTSLELSAFFTFSDTELALIQHKYKSNLRIAAALQLGFLKMAGRPLDSFRIVPRELLRHIGEQLAATAPTIASLRAIYRRRRTLFEHQEWAISTAKFQRPSDKQLARLIVHLKKEATHEIDVDGLVESAKVWLYQRGFIIPADRPIRDYARQALAESETGLLTLIRSQIAETVLLSWEKQLLRKRENSPVTYLEWVAEPPRKGTRNAFNERLDRVAFLKSMMVHRYALEGVPEAKIRLYGENMWHMRPAKFRELKEPLRTLRLVSFLVLSLRTNTDTSVLMARRHTTRLWADAYRKAELLEAKQALSAREMLDEILGLVDQEALTDAEFRARVRALKQQAKPLQFTTRAAAARWLLSEPGTTVRPLLAALDTLDVHWEKDRVSDAFVAAREQRLHGRTTLPTDRHVKVSKGWQPLIDGPDRDRAQRALEAAALLDLQKGLRNGAAWIDYSSAFNHRDKILIDPQRWAKERKRRALQMGLPLAAKPFLQRIYTALEIKLQQVADAVAQGAITISDGVIHLPRLKAEMTQADVKPLREAMFAEIGQVQLPDLILDVDSRAGFSRALLGRGPNSEFELLRLYAGMLAHATSFSATQIAQQMPPLTPEQVLAGMRLFENASRVRDANATVTSYQRQLPITRIWGDDKLASSDGMSLDVSQRLWMARLDQRRNVPSVGTYTHVVDTGALIYDQPLVLGNRQAGAAIEGVLRQQEIDIDRLAVDTHGYTAFAMSMAKMLGFDLCPRLKQLSERKLYLPKHFAEHVPTALLDIIDYSVTDSLIEKHWDDLLRIAASIETGQTNAVVALARYGTAATGDPIYRAGVALGRLLRSVYLCDYFISEAYRRIINRILVQGESIHQLQRAIYRGSFTGKPRGQREPELWALSGSLTLMTNLCLAWTTTQMQAVLDSKPIWLEPLNTEWLKSVSPGHFQNINFNGTLSFPFDHYRDRLFGATAQRRSAPGG